MAGLQHFGDVLGLVPNLNWSAGTSRPRYFQLRGIGELEQFQGAPNSSVGFLIDDIDFSGIGMPATLFDVSQVEVLRGSAGHHVRRQRAGRADQRAHPRANARSRAAHRGNGGRLRHTRCRRSRRRRAGQLADGGLSVGRAAVFERWIPPQRIPASQRHHGLRRVDACAAGSGGSRPRICSSISLRCTWIWTTATTHSRSTTRSLRIPTSRGATRSAPSVLRHAR